MHGNVWELCEDWWGHDYYGKSPTDDPAGPTSGSLRVFRGGCWNFPAGECRSANRLKGTPSLRSYNLGFRVVLVPSAASVDLPKAKTPGKAAVQDTPPSGPSAPSPPSGGTVAVEAKPGVGKKGRDYGGGTVAAPITTPVEQYFSIRQRVEFMKLTKSMQLYEVQHDGLPKTHEEFMKKIIEANLINLPELPDGESYRWDPEKGQLMVDRPR